MNIDLLKPSFPLQYNNSITDLSSYTNILLIDRHVYQSKIFYDSCNTTTFPVMYNSMSTSSDVIDLLSKFNSGVRLAFVFDHTVGRVNMLFDMLPIFNDTLNNSNVSCIKQIIKDRDIKYIDYLACNTMNDIQWKPYYDLLSNHNVVVGCSSDFTGNMVGDDWNMESTGMNIKNLYFNDYINNYSGRLGENINGNDFLLDISNSHITLQNGPNYLQYKINGDAFYDMSQNIMLIDCSLNLISNINIKNKFCFGIKNEVRFDGGKHNINFDVSGYIGLFDMIDSSKNFLTINNLTFEKTTNFTFNSSGGAFLIQPNAQGTIDIGGCNYNGNVNGQLNSGFVGIGAGYGGECSVNITNCYSGDVGGNFYNSGFVGFGAGYGGECSVNFTNCYSNTVSGNNNSGFVGFGAGYGGECSVNITNCYSGDVGGTNANSGFVGASAGYGGMCSVNFTNCYSGNVDGNYNGGFVGAYAGYVGNCSVNFTNCYSGNVSGNTNSGFVGYGAGAYTGGDVGVSKCSVNFTNCYSDTVSGNNNSGFVGAFAGAHIGGGYVGISKCSVNITNCYSGNVDGTNNSGFVGGGRDRIFMVIVL